MFAVEINNLSKSYDGVPVLRRLNLRVPSGQIYGLLGPNGAGKSTLIHLMLGFLRPNAGTIRVLGTDDLDYARSRIGYLPERLRYHMRYTGREYLRFLGQFDDLNGTRLESRIADELHAVGLTEAADRMLNTYSKGMLQRLGIAQALMSEPELLVIDEPTSGLDPAGQREMLDLLGEMRRRGLTVFLATHMLDEADQCCDRVGMLFDGQMAAQIDTESLRIPGRVVTITVGRITPHDVLRLQRVSSAVFCNGHDITLRPNTPELQATVLRMLLDAQIPIISVAPQAHALEELYMRIVRREPLENPVLPVSPPTEAPPNGLFAPPGHPDALPAPPAPPAVPKRSSNGETLLRELLQRQQAFRKGPSEKGEEE